MKTRSLTNNTCFGRFYISMKVLDNFPLVIMNDLFAKCIIVRAEHLLAENIMYYAAWSSELFEPVGEGMRPPLYRVVIENDILRMEIMDE